MAGHSETKSGALRRGLVARLFGYWRDRSGAISPMLVLALVPFLGAMAMGVEGSNWWLTQRSVQNAADSAAIAAANAGSVNGVQGDSGGTSCSVASDWCKEAEAVAANMGFTNGSNNVVVSVSPNQSCPSPLTATTCFQVIITKKLPVRLLKIVGFTGDTTIGSQSYQTVSARAMAYATGGNTSQNFCIGALGSLVNKDLTVNGGPNSALPGCAIASNGGTTCNGGSISGLNYSYAAPNDMGKNDCAGTASGNLPLRAPITDPYTAQAADIPTNTCSNPTLKASYPQEPKNGSPPAANQITGTPAWSGGTQILCGDIQLTGNTTLTAGTVMVIENGILDLNGFQLTATNSTIIFTGPSINGFSPAHIVEDNSSGSKGVLTLSAPGSTSSPPSTWSGATTSWTGFGIYTDPSLTSGIDETLSGNAPTMAINGLYYSPKANVTISGVVGSNNQCLGFMVYTLIINGNGQIIDSNSCNPVNFSKEGFLAGKVVLVQ